MRRDRGLQGAEDGHRGHEAASCPPSSSQRTAGPDTSGITPGWLRVEFHCHTTYSRDCAMAPKTLIAVCLRRGIACLAVTDHNSIRGALEVREAAPFKVIVGEEIRTTEGELVGLVLEEEVPRGLTPTEAIRRIRAQGGLVYLPHPFDRLRRSRISARGLSEVIDELDVVETLNARTTFMEDVERAMQFAQERGLPAAAGSDAHMPWEVGRAVVEMPNFAGRETFLAALRQGRIQGRLSPQWVHVASMATRWLKRVRGRV